MPARTRLVLVIAAAFVALQVLTTRFGPYGYFIDELYYLACAKHLALGYVDHPPLSIFVLAAVRAILGDSTLAIRLPAIASVAATVVASGAIARRLGGGAIAQALAALATATAPFALIVGSFASMNAYELLLWTLILLVFARLAATNDPRAWLGVGALLGVALENKHTAALLGAALAIGALATPLRSHYATRWPWIGAALALAIFVPNLAWQASHGFPSLEFYAAAQASKNVPTPPLQAFLNQVKISGPASLLLWIPGAVWFLRAERARPFRALGLAFALLFAMMLVSGASRPDRIAGLYPTMFAAGAVALEGWSRERARRAGVAITSVAQIALGAVFAPLALPLLAPPTLSAYAAHLGVSTQLERGNTPPIPQWLADRRGWPELAAKVDGVLTSLTPEERAHAAVFCSRYGQAGAIELLSRERPRVISGHNSYWTWGPGDAPIDVLVAIGADDGDLDALFEEHAIVAEDRCDECPPWRARLPIVLARKPKMRLQTIWERARDFE